MDQREKIARRAVLELDDGTVVNLGFGIPTAIVDYIGEKDIVFQSENGCLLFGPTPQLGDQDSDTANAGGMPISFLPGASVFDLATSFGIIRGGHIDVTVLGALEVDQYGNIANWSMPGRVPGMGGAMDLVIGARKVITVLKHVDKKGKPKIVKQCKLPLTGKGVVDTIITDKAVFQVTPAGLVLKEIEKGLGIEELQKITEAEFSVDPYLLEYRLCEEKADSFHYDAYDFAKYAILV